MWTTIYNVVVYAETDTEKRQFLVNDNKESSQDFSVFGVTCARSRVYADKDGGVNIRIYCSSGVGAVLIGAHARCQKDAAAKDTEVLRFYPVSGGNGNVSVSCETKWVADAPAKPAAWRSL